MGQSKNEFMNVRMSCDTYHDLPNEVKENIDIKVIDEEGHDYKDSELWTAQKKKADKEFRELKRIEFELRHKTKKDDITK